MALSIVGIARDGGPGCDHVTVTISDEGTVRAFKSSYGELDDLIASKGGRAEGCKELVMLWVAYRRSQSRPIIAVDIA